MYLDEETDRIGDRVTRDVEVVRAGTVFASNLDAYRKWLRAIPRRHGPGLTGAALEAAVMNIARLFPENVVRGTA